MTTIRSIDDAVAYVDGLVAAHPERDAATGRAAAIRCQPRRYALVNLNHLSSPDDTAEPQDEFELPPVDVPDTPEGQLARQIVGLANPLKMLNPINRSFGVSHGPGTFVTCFGIPLNPEAVDTPAFTRPVAELLAEDPPDPASAGLIADMHERIDFIKAHTPAHYTIGMPDFQGPFNLVTSMLGDEAMYAPYEDPEAFHALMDRVTDFWIAAFRHFQAWIGPERLAPAEVESPRIAECAVNLVSRAMYEEHILPYDRRLAAMYGRVRIHPCSGPHVFHATLEGLPNVVHTEAGYIEQTAAGSISVDEALAAIGDRPVFLQIGQELPPGEEYAFIRADLDRYAEHPGLMFSYTGMHWRKKDRPKIRDIHRRLDEYWEQRYGDSASWLSASRRSSSRRR